MPTVATTPAAPRRRIVVIVIAVAAVVTAGGLWAATLIKSPAQVAADAAPPPPSVLTAPVENRVVSQTLTARGEVVNASVFTANTPPAAGQPGMITKIPAGPGTKVEAGGQVLELSGRPVFVLAGATPSYRDLAVGASGEDIAQLQRGLAGLGFGSGGDKAGTYGAGTASAVDRFYKRLGYPALTSGDPAAVKAAADAVEQKKREAAADPAAKQALAAAEQELRRLRAENVAKVPAGEVVFVSQLPATVSAVGGAVGQVAKDPVLTLAVGTPVVRAKLPVSQRAKVAAGMAARIVDADGKTRDAKVTDVGAPVQPEPGTGNAASEPPYVPVTLTPAEALSPAAVSQQVQVALSVDSTAGPVLAVPAAAIFARADGGRYVQVHENGATRTVSVVAGKVGDGFVEITPQPAGALAEGTPVVIGTAEATPAPQTQGPGQG